MEKLEALKHYFGYDAFRPGQEELIDRLLTGCDVLGVMPTGAGKSLCFQLPALLLGGVTLVVSPLISLMKDQVNSLTQAGISAAYLNSSLTPAQYAAAMRNARRGQYRIIYVAPERLMTEDFLSFAQSTQISLVTVDEAHCVSQWGQDFRPQYLRVAEFIGALPHRPPVGAFTATATARVREDILQKLQLQTPFTLVTGFDRPNLRYAVEQPRDKFAALTEFLRAGGEKAGIVYCATRKTVEEVCERLNGAGFSARRYHAGLPDEERRGSQDDFLYDRCRVMVATNAFGMGIDKSNVSFVVHYNMPKNMESYYQEAGRAGRDGSPADCLLLYSGQDIILNRWLIDHTEENSEMGEEERRAFRRNERDLLNKMALYCQTGDCLRRYILAYFGENAPESCGNCGNCDGGAVLTDITVEAQKVLSCVKRAGERYGALTIAETLHGAESEKLKHAGLDQLTTHGIMSDTPIAELRRLITGLVQQRYLVTQGDDYPVLALGPRAEDVLFRGARVSMRTRPQRPAEERRRSSRRAAQTGYAPHPALLERLKKLRAELAAKQSVPAYVIFTDASLTDMCRQLPADSREFLQVSGVGEAKLKRYGEAFLREIETFVAQNPGVKENKVSLAPVETGRDLTALCAFAEAESHTLRPREEPCTVSVLADQINALLASRFDSKLSAAAVNRWLMAGGFLRAEEQDGESHRVPTARGEELGIVTVEKAGRGGRVYRQTVYSPSAQAFVYGHLGELLQHAFGQRADEGARYA